MKPYLPLLVLLHPTFCLAETALHPIFIPSPGQQPIEPVDTAREFSLRYIFHHGTHKHPDLHRRLEVTDLDSLSVVDPTGSISSPPSKLRVRSENLRIERLRDRSQGHIDYLLDTGRMRGEPLALDASAWTVDDVPGPNVTDKEGVLSLAKISANAYISSPGDAEWFDIGPGFNDTEDFGWENDGLRGHIFADTNNETVIIGLKGTSPAVFDGSGTTTNDKVNDNLFFSCCCGQGGRYGWLEVCSCQTSAFRCNNTCVVDALRNKNRYYYAAQEIYRNVSQIYPDANIWLAGHSLGGSTASLVALTYGIPVVTFEAPAEAMPAKRLGLPTPPGYHLGAHQQRISTGGFHFGHTADPIFMGKCNTYSSVCTIAGYAMQSVCHTGQTCIYDTVGDLGWRVGAGTHKIVSVIKDVIQVYESPAVCEPIRDCTDCFAWDFFESNHTTATKTSMTTTSKPTQTTTCETPGWFGCLDESTTTSKTKTKTTTTTTTTTCKTPGWFGCNDDETTEDPPITTHMSTSPPSTPTQVTTTSTTSSSCHSPGWFGCKDPTSQPSTGSGPPTSVPQTSTSPSIPTQTASPTCIHRSWYGRCTQWSIGRDWGNKLEF